MKKLIAGAAVAGTLFAGAYAFAAGLTVDSGDLAAGGDGVAACQALTDDAVVAYTDVAFDTDEYELKELTVTFDGNGCDGQTVEVTLLDSTDAVLDESAPATVVAGTNTATLEIDGVEADLVDEISVVVTGDQPA